MTYELPPMLKLSERLLVEIEEAYPGLIRKYRYGFGDGLRQSALRVALLAKKTWNDRENREVRIKQLDDAVEDLKLRITTGGRLRAYSSRGQFENLARNVNELGRQVGGWTLKLSQHSKGQNASSRASTQRASSLSTRATSREVNL